MPPQTVEDSLAKNELGEETPLLKVDDAENAVLSGKPWLAMALDELIIQSETALPTLQGMVFTKIPWLISLRFVGGMGALELAAAALATTLCNVTGLSLSVGLSSALSTLSGQAKGELVSRMLHNQRRKVSFDLADTGNHTMTTDTSLLPPNFEEPITTVIFFWRGMAIQLCLVIPVAIWWITGVKDLLIKLGQAEDLSTMTDSYLRVLAPGLLGYSINWT